MKSRFKNLWRRSIGCPTGSAEARQISLFGLAEETASSSGCPIAFQEAAEFEFLPQSRADQGEEPGEAVSPLAQKGAEAQQHIGQQSRPNLPAHGVGAVPQEVGQLEGLFELLEEDLNAPAAAIEVGDGLGAPDEVVGQKNHFAEFAVDLDQRHYAAQPDRINFLHGRVDQFDQVIAQEVVEAPRLQSAHDAALQVVLGTSNPENLATGQVRQVCKVHVSLVENDNFTRLNTGAKFTCPAAVMLASGIHDGTAGQEGLEVEPDMTFGGGLAPTMLGPVQRAGHQLDGGRIHDVNEPLETEGEPGRAVAAKSGLQRLQMFQHRPEELLGHFRIPPTVGMRERVLVRRSRSAQCRQRPGVQAQSVAHVIESQAVGQLRVEQADDMAPRTERAGVIFHAGLVGQMRHQMRRNEVAKLAQERKLAAGWLVSCLIFHALPCGKAQTRKPTFFTPQPSTLWDSSELIL